MNTQGKQTRQEIIQAHMPTMEELQREMAEVESLDDFFGKEGILGRLFGQMLETMMQAELTEQLGYEPYEAKGRNSGNSRNGTRPRTVKSSAGKVEVRVPRDRNSEYQPIILERYGRNTNELEEKILGLYAKGMTTRDCDGLDLIYTTNPIESYNRQLRKVTKNKAAFPAPAAVRNPMCQYRVRHFYPIN